MPTKFLVCTFSSSKLILLFFQHQQIIVTYILKVDLHGHALGV